MSQAPFAPRAIGLVWVGGALGAGTREALTLAFPAVNGIPLTILAINIGGALLLGLLLSALAARGPDEGLRRDVRLLCGTGLMGGFTTYSALGSDTAHLILTGRVAAGVGYALATVVVGALASWAGIVLGRRLLSRGGTPDATAGAA